MASPERVDLDAGQLCGRKEVGVRATDDAAAILTANPDCVAYCATAVRREAEAIADIATYLEAGLNVVAISAIPMVYPPAEPRHW